MDINLKYLKVKNFLSFGNKLQTHEFERNSIVNIKGRNLDAADGKENGSSNGSGKSSIMQAVVYALYGQGVNDIKQDEFVNITNGSDMMVELSLDIGDKDVLIRRCRKPNRVELLVDGVDCTRDSVANTNAFIQSLIRVNFDTFVLSFLMTTAVQPLLSRKPSEQKNFMEDLLGMNTLTERATAVKGIRDELQVDVRLIDRDIENAESINRRELAKEAENKQQYDSFEIRRVMQRDDLMAKKEKAATELDSVDENMAALDEKAAAESALQEADGVFSKAKEALSAAELKKERLSRKIDALSRGVDACKRDLDAQVSAVEDSEKALQTATEKAEEAESLSSKLDEYLDLVEAFESAQSQYKSSEAELQSKESEVKRLRGELEHLRGGSCPRCNQDWTTVEKQQEVDRLTSKEAELTEDISSLTTLTTELNSGLGDIANSLEATGLTDEKAGDIADQIEKASRSKEMAASALNAASDRKVELEKALQTAIDEAGTLGSLNDEMSDLEETVDGLFDSLECARKIADTARQAYTTASESLNSFAFSSHSAIERALDKFERIKEDLKNVVESENPYKDPETYVADVVDVSEYEQKKADIDKQLTHCKYLIKLLTDSKSFIRRNIIGKYVPYLNKMINTYTAKLDSPHVCEIQNDLSVSIEYMRRPVSYHSLSAGERLKLDISVSVALRDLMGMLGIKSGTLFVDEIFDSALDTQSKKSVFSLMKERFSSVMLVSHSGEFDDKCDQVLTVTKENGFSRLD